MFNKTSDQTAAPGGVPAARPSNTKSVFASDLKITGEISSIGDIEMMGDIDGNITARSLSVGAEGRMNGTITAESVDVRGTVDGQISASTFTLRAAAHVAADVTYKTLVIESGAQIEGRFARHKG
ncbi:bactofilin family protein [Pseudotabrizicola algicola]|uniref:Polymer-forming cytoskeletal protein n=1 Tax=Pseudotabrizicola algicola TaxID=2709381 RepID=A0A6B3RSZ1_9RHOB|nr:polymer-forming cytoskeletal protein [Pseudotabrizicola algicola]NEX48316.1 polymer-forming cytoskeletal protein [Pseudotabrizicola algicola]